MRCKIDEIRVIDIQMTKPILCSFDVSEMSFHSKVTGEDGTVNHKIGKDEELVDNFCQSHIQFHSGSGGDILPSVDHC
jgi:hypothetical protein